MRQGSQAARLRGLPAYIRTRLVFTCLAAFLLRLNWGSRFKVTSAEWGPPPYLPIPYPALPRLPAAPVPSHPSTRPLLAHTLGHIHVRLHPSPLLRTSAPPRRHDTAMWEPEPAQLPTPNIHRVRCRIPSGLGWTVNWDGPGAPWPLTLCFACRKSLGLVRRHHRYRHRHGLSLRQFAAVLCESCEGRGTDKERHGG